MQKGSSHSPGSSGTGNTGTNSSNSNHSNNSNSHSKSSSNQNSDHHHQNPLSQFNDFLKSTFSFSSSSNSSNRNTSSAVSPTVSSPLISPNASNKNAPNGKSALVTMALSTAPTNLSPVSSTSLYASSKSHLSTSTEHIQQTSVDFLNLELSQQLTLENQRKNENTTNIPNCAKVINAYAAITEDEITVQKGDVVQIITANMHNRFLVHREASEHQPAAEGWIPGFVIGFQSTNMS